MQSLFKMQAAERPVPPAPAVREPAAYTWYGCDLVSGAIVEELPFVASGPLQAIIGAYTAASGSLAISDCPPNWERATDPMRTMLVCVRNSDLRPLWAGMVLSRTGGSDNLVTLNLATLEAYLDRRYVPYTATFYDRLDTIARYIFDSTNTEGVGFVYPAVLGTMTDSIQRTYSNDADQTVYSAMSELMASLPFEWTIKVDWKDATKSSFKKYLEGGHKVYGASGDVPRAVFDMPGCVSSYVLTEDYTSSKGSNHITMFGDGEGTTRPTSGPVVAQTLINAGWPRVEYRATQTGVVLAQTLIDHAEGMLAWKQQGAQIFTVTADATNGPLLGVDWNLGDTIAVDVAWSPRHPDGFNITARAIGWELDTAGSGTVTPLLQEESDDA